MEVLTAKPHKLCNSSFAPHFLSAPTSPDRHSLEDSVSFDSYYSVPPSPQSDYNYNTNDPNSSPLRSTPPTYSQQYHNFINTDHDFQFDTSLRFDKLDQDGFFTLHQSFVHSPIHQNQYNYPVDHQIEYKKQRPRCESLPSMAFADELFANGKVRTLRPQNPKTLTLKPPPKFYTSPNQSPKFSSPKSPSSPTRFPFSRRNLWNDDFDPFMVALENVKENKQQNPRSNPKSSHSAHRRTRSLSPFRNTSPHRKADSTVAEQPHAPGFAPEKQNQQSPETAGENNRDIGNRKRSDLVGKSGFMWANGGISENCTGKDATNLRVSKRQRIKRFLLRSISSSSSTSSSGEEKTKGVPGDEVINGKGNKGTNGNFSNGGYRAISRPSHVMGRLIFWRNRNRNVKAICSSNAVEDKKVTAVAKVALVQYRPSLFLCLGYGMRGGSRFMH